MTESTVIEGVDYGPLALLVGTWTGDKGLDIAPEPDGTEENPYYETLVFEAVGDVDNAETQELAALRYHQVISRKSDNNVFHNETGYWMWDAKERTVMHSLTIPRGVCVLAGGKFQKGSSRDEVVLQVRAADGDSDWGIVQSPFMKKNARTLEFRHSIQVSGDKLSYEETTVLDIYGRRFEHTDSNKLTRS